MEATCGWYGGLFGARLISEHAEGGKVFVRQIAMGGAMLSVHQSGNGLEGPTARRTADGLPSRSVYFRDPDGNLLELMAADSD